MTTTTPVRRATAVLFLSSMMLEACVSMLGDRRTYRRGSLRRALRTVRRSPFLDRRVIGRLRDYNRPDFHPDDHDTDALFARWQDDLFGDDGRFVERLTTAA